nr:MAG TPA: hydrolase [Bacteriophage sp.]
MDLDGVLFEWIFDENISIIRAKFNSTRFGKHHFYLIFIKPILWSCSLEESGEWLFFCVLT